MDFPELAVSAPAHDATDNRAAGDFYQLSRDARKILIVDIGRLGDAVHMLPAIQGMRRNYPKAQLHVLMGNQAFFQKLAPWVDMAWPAMHQVFGRNLKLIGQLRRERFDAVFLFSYDDCAICVARLAGAPRLFGKRTPPDKRWWWQKALLTRWGQYPLQTQPMFYQKWICLKQAGLSLAPPAFVHHMDPVWLGECGIDEIDRKSYIHVSPYTSAMRRDLPVEQSVALLDRMIADGHRVVLSCDPSAEQKTRLQDLVTRLAVAPWKLFAGNLEIHQFAALIGGAKLHLGGDTGSLHLARMTNTPSVNWFRIEGGNPHWAPTVYETQHAVFYSGESPEDALHGIENEKLFSAIQARL